MVSERFAALGLVVLLFSNAFVVQIFISRLRLTFNALFFLGSLYFFILAFRFDVVISSPSVVFSGIDKRFGAARYLLARDHIFFLLSVDLTSL